MKFSQALSCFVAVFGVHDFALVATGEFAETAQGAFERFAGVEFLAV